MLRALVALLLLANLLMWVWSRQGLSPWLEGPGQGQREPGRLAQQVQPDALRVLGTQAASAALDQALQREQQRAADAASGAASANGADPTRPAVAPAASAASAASPGASGAAAASAPVSATLACLETAPLAAPELARAEQALRAVQPGLRWTTLRQERGGVFIVYMGRYPDRAQMLKKQDELKRLGVAFQEMSDSPTLVPGLQLGRYDSRAAATSALADFTRQGVRSARVAMLVAPVPVAVLRLDRPAAALADRLQTLDLGAGDARFKACAAPPPRA